MRLTPLVSKVIRTVVGCDVFNVNTFMGVNDSRHGVPPSSQHVSSGVRGLPPAEHQYAGTGTASGEGQSSHANGITSHEEICTLVSKKRNALFS